MAEGLTPVEQLNLGDLLRYNNVMHSWRVIFSNWRFNPEARSELMMASIEDNWFEFNPNSRNPGLNSISVLRNDVASVLVGQSLRWTARKINPDIVTEPLEPSNGHAPNATIGYEVGPAGQVRFYDPSDSKSQIARFGNLILLPSEEGLIPGIIETTYFRKQPNKGLGASMGSMKIDRTRRTAEILRQLFIGSPDVISDGRHVKAVVIASEHYNEESTVQRVFREAGGVIVGRSLNEAATRTYYQTNIPQVY